MKSHSSFLQDLSSKSESPNSMISSSCPFNYIDEPLELIAYSARTHNFVLSSEGLKFLRSLSSPLAVISVAGPNKTGKSYLLNQLLPKGKSGFGVGRSDNTFTKGIWVWGRPLLGTTKEGQPCSIIIIDTEGIGVQNQDPEYDIRIFSLAILISSSLIYNSFGPLDENSFQNLSLLSNLSQHIHLKSMQKEEIDPKEYAQYFPNFIWVIRDFSLNLSDSNDESSIASEYLEKTLQNQKGFGYKFDQNNRIKELLKFFFQDRECFILACPGYNESDLQNIEKQEIDELRPEFVKQVGALRKRMFEGIEPKMLNGKNLNGEILASLLENYFAALNYGFVPNIENAWNFISKNECAKALQEAQEIYKQIIGETVSNNLPISQENLKSKHKSAKLSALNLFESKAIGPEVHPILKKLKTIISNHFKTINQENSILFEKKSQDFLSNSYSQIGQKLQNNDYSSIQDFNNEIKNLKKSFLILCPGPFDSEILFDFYFKKITDTADYFINEFQNKAKFVLIGSAEQIKVFATELKEIKDDLVLQGNGFQRNLKEAESEKIKILDRELSLNDKILKLEIEKDKVENELRNVENMGIGVKREGLNSKFCGDKESVKEIEKIKLKMNFEFEEKNAILEQRIKYLESCLEESRKQEKDYLMELRSIKKGHSSDLRDIQKRFETQIKN